MELLMARTPPEEKAAEGSLEFETLVRRSLAGDSAAFEQVVIRHERRVLSLALRLLRTPQDAQDAAQEVFLRAFKYLHRLDPDKPAEPWLMRITVNVCRDIGRKRARLQQTFTDLTATDTRLESSPGPAADPHQDLAMEQQRALLWKALHALPEKEKLAVILRDVEGFSTSEAAEILGSSESTVRSQICRGRLRLKENLDGMMGGRL